MALALYKAAPLKADILLAQALSEFKAILDGDAKTELQSLCNAASPTANDVMRLTAEIDRANLNQKRRQCFGPRLTNVLQSVQQFSTVVDTLVGGIAIASTIWGVLKLTLQITTNFSSFFDELSSLFMKIGRTTPRYQELAILYPQSVQLQISLCRYYTVVINVCKEAVLFTRKCFVSQIPFLIKSFKSVFGRFGDDLDRLAVAVREEVTLASNQLQRDEADKSSHFRTLATQFFSENAALERKKRKSEKAKSRLLDACSTYNHQTAWKQARKRGNTNWLFEKDEYTAWRREQTVSSALWCTGILGSGKTVLCANIVDNIMLTCPTAVVAYFFCRHDEAISLKARTVLGSIARQLLSGPNHQFIDDSSLANTEFIDSSEILQLIQKLLLPDQQYFILIDGIDECAEEEGVLLAQNLQQLLYFKLPLHLYYSSRPDTFHRLLAHFKLFRGVRVAIPATNHEIDQFIDAELEQRLESNSLCLGELSTIIAIRDALSIGAQGMFLWVRFQIETLCAQPTDAAILSALKDLPKDLPETYNRHLKKLRYSKASDPALCMRIFQILTAAQRPLTTEELRHAASVIPGMVAWDPKNLINDITKAIDACGSLLIVDEEESTVQFAHHSVKQHLLSSPTASSVGEFHVNLKEADVRLGEICVTYLSLDVFSLQVQKPHRNLQIEPINIPSAISPSSSTHSKLINRAAIRLLKARRRPSKTNFDFQYHVQKAANTTHESGGEQAFTFLSYARDYWLHHSRNFEKASVSEEKTLSLWAHHIKGAPSLILPWAPESLGDFGPLLLNWILHNQHGALLHQLTESLLDLYIVDYSFGMATAGRFMQFLREWGHSLKFKPYFFGCALHIASALGDNDVVHLLLEKGVDANKRGPLFGTALVAATKGGSTKLVQLLLGTRVKINATFVILSADDAHSKSRRVMTESNQRNELETDYFSTALNIAAKNGFCEIIELLLEYGAAINIPDFNDETALFAASKAGKKNAVKLLLDKGADVDLHMKGRSEGTALTAALGDSRVWDEELMLPLLNAVWDLNKHMTFRDTGKLLHTAYSTGSEAAVKLLIEKGADVNARNSAGATLLLRTLTPSLMTTETGTAEAAIVKLLLQHGADVNAADADGSTAIHRVTGHKDDWELMVLLVTKGANVNAKTKSGDRPLHTALRHGRPKDTMLAIVEHLIWKGADINACNELGETALHIAASANPDFLPSVSVLLENGADLDLQDDAGKTPRTLLRMGDESV